MKPEFVDPETGEVIELDELKRQAIALHLSGVRHAEAAKLHAVASLHDYINSGGCLVEVQEREENFDRWLETEWPMSKKTAYQNIKLFQGQHHIDRHVNAVRCDEKNPNPDYTPSKTKALEIIRLAEKGGGTEGGNIKDMTPPQKHQFFSRRLMQNMAWFSEQDLTMIKTDREDLFTETMKFLAEEELKRRQEAPRKRRRV